MNLNNISSITIGNKTINHIETVYNPNLKEIYQSTTLMSKSAVIEMLANISDSSVFLSKYKQDILFDKADIDKVIQIEAENFYKITPYNYAINSTTIETLDDTTDTIYIPYQFFTETYKFENTATTININKPISKIALSRHIIDVDIVNNNENYVINVYYPNLDLSANLNENTFYILGHGNTYKQHNISKNFEVSRCKGIVLGKDYFDGIIDENQLYGNFDNVDKIFVYTNSFDSSIATAAEKKVIVARVLSITDSSKIYLYGRPNYIYDITNNTQEYECENTNGWVIKPTNSEINIDTISNGKEFVLDLSVVSGPITITRSNTNKSNNLLNEIIINNNTIATTPGTLTRGFDKCRTLNTVHTTTTSDNLFTNCNNLTKIIISSSTTIGENCFRNCYSLKEIAIPDTVNTFKPNAFTNCEELERIYIFHPDEITFNGTTNGLKDDCTVYVSLINITAAENYFTNCYVVPITDNIMYYSGHNPILDFTDNNYERGLVIMPDPDNVPDGILSKSGTGIEDKIETVILNKVDTIADGTFENCVNLNNLTISTTIRDLGTSTFKQCTSLTSIKIPTSISDIGASCFEQCSSLSNVVIPDTVTSIDESAFNGCNLSSVIN